MDVLTHIDELNAYLQRQLRCASQISQKKEVSHGYDRIRTMCVITSPVNTVIYNIRETNKVAAWPGPKQQPLRPQVSRYKPQKKNQVSIRKRKLKQWSRTISNDF